MRLINSKKAFSLIELLVVVVLIGIISIVAVPNVKSFFADRELRSAVLKISSIVTSLKSEIESGKSDPNTNLAYEMAQIVMGSDDNGFFIDTKLRDSQKFKQYRLDSDGNCNINNPDTYWNSASLKTYDYRNYDEFSSIRTEFKYSGTRPSLQGNYVHCFAKDPERTYDQQNDMILCHKDNAQTTGRACVAPTVDNNYPYYLLRFRRTGQVVMHKYNIKTSGWDVISN